MSTTQSTITTDMTSAEAANLLARLEEGHEAAWLSTRELSWQSPEYESRFQNAKEIDSVFRDLMRETIDNGMRHPGEPVEEFAERTESEAWLAEARKADPENQADSIIQRADTGLTPDQVGKERDEAAARLLNDASTSEGEAFASAFSDAAAARARDLRGRDPLPEPDRTPGAPHPDPFLAGRGWHVNERGIYTRRAEPDPQPQARSDNELEAG